MEQFVIKSKKENRSILKKLRNINPDVVVWVSIPGAGIDYLIVQGKTIRSTFIKPFGGTEIHPALSS